MDFDFSAFLGDNLSLADWTVIRCERTDMLDNLSPEHSQYIVAAIASGRYQSEAEALNQAVRLLQRRDQLEHAAIAGTQIDAGPASMPKKCLRLARETTRAVR